MMDKERPNLDMIKERLEDILNELEVMKNELIGMKVSMNEENLEKLQEIKQISFEIYNSVLDINIIIFNKYWDMRERVHIGVAPVDVSEDAEETYIKTFIESVESLKDYNVEQLYNYMKNIVNEDEKEQ